ncbi:MAG TPA: tetratricopeptide repeat protein [Dissulfurispiraceae bacterium]|nr:tetratricopeptide repeat protein [Dissulfurispiraceae bacterium]
MKKKNKKPVKPVKADRIILNANTPEVYASPGGLSLANNTLVHMAGLVFLILIIYANTLNAPFQWDDNEYIVNNPIIKNLHYFSTPSDAKGFEYYSALVSRFIGYLTFALNYRIHGLSVTGYHIVNIAIHVANSILVYFLVLLTFRTPYFMDQEPGIIGHRSPAPCPQSLVPDPWSLTPELVAFFSAAIFAAHPLQIEAVTYIFQRFASLVTFFYLLSLVSYIKARLSTTSKKDSGQAGMTESPSPLTTESSSRFTSHISHSLSPFTFFVLSFVSAVLAMKTKENAFTLPFVIVLYEFCFFSRSFSAHDSRLTTHGLSRPFTFLIPILLTLFIIPVSLMSMGTAGSVMHQLDPASYGATVFSRSEYLFTQFRIIVTYLRLLFFPVNQNIDYDYPVFGSFFTPQIILSFLFLTALIGLGVYFIRSSRFTIQVSRPLRLMGFGLLWFFITLSVESSIIPISTIIDEYRVYLPSAGLIICVVTGAFCAQRFLLSRLKVNYSRLLLIIFALAIGVLSIAAHERNAVWGDGIRLWEDTAQKSPARARVHLCLGNIYQAGNMFDKAVEQYLIAVKLKPDFVEAHNNLGAVYQFLKMPDKAMEQFLIAVKLKPDFAEAQLNLGIIYQTLDMPEKAVEKYMAAIKLRPDLAEAHNHLGFVYFKMGQMENARRELSTGLSIKPDDQWARQLLEKVSH